MKLLTGSEYPREVIPLLNGARQSIDIISYDWRWYENEASHPVQRFNQAIVGAVKRGVQVRAVLNTDLIVATLKGLGVKARKMKDTRTLHTKMIFVDRRILIMGSHNLTKNAFVSNIETSLLVEVPQEYTRVSEFFENIFSI